MLMFRATFANLDVKVITVNHPVRPLDDMVYQLCTTDSTGDSTHHHECWFLDAERLQTHYMLQCLVTFPRLSEV